MTDTTLMTADTTTDEAASQTATEETAAPAAKTEEAQHTALTAPDAETDKVEGEPAKEGEAEDDKADDAPKGAPEAYEDFTVPEGVELDPEVTAKFKDVAKELNLPQEAAQKVTELGVELAQKWAAQQTETTEAILAEWKTATETDKEIGGDTLPANLAVAKQALDKFGTPELRSMLDEYRMGDHPEVIRFMVRVGKAISEDTFVGGGTATPPRDRAKTLFPDMN